ncbi:MAG: hypothetical protein ACLP8S_20100 [Solirubrobacteraceae bacterium]
MEGQDPGFCTTPARISIARRIVWSTSQASPPGMIVAKNGITASLISHVAEFHRYDGLWSTA